MRRGPAICCFRATGSKTEAGPASFLFCPGKTLDTLTPSGEVRLDAKAPKVKSGKITEQPARACTLPQTLRVAAASQQHYGVSMTRGLNKPEVPPTPRDKLAADVQAELAPYETVLAGESEGSGGAGQEATIFENHKLTANALDAYYKLREQWPDAVWVKSKIFDLEQALARSGGRRHRRSADWRARPMRCWWASRNTPSPSCRCSSPTPTPACSASCWRARWAAVFRATTSCC